MMFCICLVLYWFGATSIFQEMVTNQGGRMSFDNIIGRITDVIWNRGDPTVLALLGAALVVTVASLLTGYASMYVIPLVIAFVIANLFLFPLDELFNPSFPPMISVPLMLILNLLLVMAVIDFIRGKT
jgi:amino acid permease